MTWPEWGEVLPLLASLLAALGAVIGGMVALARLARPWIPGYARRQGKRPTTCAPRSRRKSERWPRSWRPTTFPTSRPGSRGACTTWGSDSTGWKPESGNGSTGRAKTGRTWRDGLGNGSTAWRPICWRRFSGDRTRTTPKPEHAAWVARSYRRCPGPITRLGCPGAPVATVTQGDHGLLELLGTAPAPSAPSPWIPRWGNAIEPRARARDVEEPGNGVHPSGLNAVWDSLAAVRGSQLLVTTCSAALVARAEPEQAVCFAGGVGVVKGSGQPLLGEREGPVG